MCESSLFTRGFTHFGSFRGKRMAPEPKLRCLYIFQFHFAVFHRKGRTGLRVTSPQRSNPGPGGAKKSESTHYQTRQFAQNNTCSDVFQSLFFIQKKSYLSHICVFSLLQELFSTFADLCFHLLGGFLILCADRDIGLEFRLGAGERTTMEQLYVK